MVKAQRASGKGLGHKLGQNKDWVAVLSISLALLVLRALYLLWWTPYTLAPDEAQYWHWLSHPALAYVTKPALTTWLMGVSTSILGDTMLGVRAFALLAQAAVPMLAFALVRLRGGQPWAAWLAFVVLATMPLIAAGGLIMSPDAMLLPLWLSALLAVTVALDGKRARWMPWLAVGVLVGLGGLAKYTAVLFFPLLGLYLLLYRREVLARPQVWVAGLVALALQAPTLYWNATNGWAGLEHLLWQTDGGGDARHGGVKTLADFIGGQVLVLGPLGFGLVVWAVMIWVKGLTLRALKKQPRCLMLWMSVPIVLGFVVMTLSSKVQANWPLLGTVGALVAACTMLPALPRARRTVRQNVLLALGALGLAAAVVLSLALHYTPLLHSWGVPVKIDPTKEMLGYGHMGFVTGMKLDTLQPPRVMLATRYQTAAELAFNVPGRPTVLYVNPGDKRMTEYDRWDWPSLKDTMVLYVNERPELSPPVATRFENCQPYGSFMARSVGDRQTYRTAWYWVCWGDRYADAVKGLPEAK